MISIYIAYDMSNQIHNTLRETKNDKSNMNNVT
jgi:hypothetical protein